MVKQLYTDLQLLLNDLDLDVKQYLQQVKNGIFNEVGRDNYTMNQLTFSWWNYFIFMLYKLTYPDSWRETFVMTLKNYYQDKSYELKILDEFKETYTPEKAIWWYTRDTFIYRLLNTALRQKNIEVIFLFAFFIKDMYVQLKNKHEDFKNSDMHNPIVKVYRGQIISSDEVRILEYATTFINNSFLSTTLDRSLALFLLDSLSQRNDQSQNILFEIELDTRHMSRPFGDIFSLSAIPNENEVLFMIGIHFKLVQCSYDDKTNIYLAKLKLEDDSTIELDCDCTGMTVRATLKNCILDLLNHTYEASFEEINTLFTQLIELFLTEKKWLEATKHHCIAQLYYAHDLESNPDLVNIALSNFEQALTSYQLCLNDTELDCAGDICHIHRNIGLIYETYLKDNILATKHYDTGIIFGISALQTVLNKYKRMDIYDTIVYICQNKIAITNDDIERGEIVLDGIKYRKLQLEDMLKHFPCNDINFSRCFESLAELQKSIGRGTEALMNYEKAVQILLLQQKPGFYSSSLLYGRISKMYLEQKTDYTLALSYKQKELEYLRKYKAAELDNSETSINHLFGDKYQELADIYVQRSEYKLAHKNLIIAKQFHEDSNYYDKEKKITMIGTKIRSVEEHLLEEYGLTELFTIN